MDKTNLMKKTKKELVDILVVKTDLIKGYQKHCANIEAQLKDAQATITSKDELIENLKDLNTDLERRLKGLEKDFNGTVESYTKQIDTLDTSFNDLKKKYDVLSEDYKAAVTEAANDINKLQVEHNSAVDDFHSTIDEYTTNLTEYEGKFNRCLITIGILSFIIILQFTFILSTLIS